MHNLKQAFCVQIMKYIQMQMEEEVAIQGPKNYFDLIVKVGSKGAYQRNLFLIFSLNWFVAGILLMGTSFMFLNPKFDCDGNGFEGGYKECEKTICAMDQSEWQKYLKQPLVKSLATEFGPYLCNSLQQLNSLRTILYVGTFVGYFCFLCITDNYGRKVSLVVTWAVTLFGVFILCIAQNMAMACVGLFFAGAGCQSAIRINMAFLGEVVDYHRRQSYSVALQIAFGFSGVMVGVLYWIFRQWRIVTIFFCGIPCLIVLLFFIFYIQQTPKFLVTKKGIEKTIKSLNRIGKINQNTDNIIKKEDIKRVYEQQQVGGQKYADIVVKPHHLFTYKSLRVNTICCCLIFLFITYLYFGPIIIIDDLGFDPFLAQILLSLSELISYPISFWFIQKIPRIKSGYICFAISAVFTGILIFVVPPKDCDGCPQIIVRAILMFGSRFIISFYFSIYFLYVTEVYPLRVRGLGFGIASAAGAIASSSGQFIFQQMQVRGINPMIFFTIFAILSIITLKFLKQTLNQPLQTQILEIQNLKNQQKKHHTQHHDHNNAGKQDQIDSHRQSLCEQPQRNIQMVQYDNSDKHMKQENDNDDQFTIE